jgi:hypothetical protein
MNKGQKKAQLGIFIVLGAILVLLAVLALSFSGDSIPLFSDQKPSAPIKDFVESCIELQSQTGIERLGYTGGWLYSQGQIPTNRAHPEELNQRATALSILEREEIPYWYYYDDSSETFSFNIPEYDSEQEFSMRMQLRRYIEETLEERCLQSFETFSQSYDITYDPEELEVEVEFSDDLITTQVFLPLEIDVLNTNSSELITSFEVETENLLYVPYHLAREITLAEAESSFVERRILNFLAPYQTSDSRDLLPPFYDFEVTFDFRPWILPDVETLMKQIVNTHISKIQFLNTDAQVNELPEDLRGNEFAESLNSLYTKDYLSETSELKEEDSRLFRAFQNYEVKPKYELIYPSFISIAPGMGDQILLPRPEAVIELIPFFFTEYVSVYEMTLPVVFELKESNAQDAFVFNLALETNIDHNAPLAENFVLNLDLEALNLQASRSLICDPSQFISQPVYLNISDPINFGNRNVEGPSSEIEDAYVTFECKGITSCFVQQSEASISSDDKTQLQFRLPINCDPGTLEVYKYGHKTLLFEDLDPNLESPINLGEHEMPSEKELNVEIKLLDATASRFDTGERMSENQRAFIIFQHVEDEKIIQVMEVNGENQDELSLRLSTGNYSIQSFLIYEDPIVIPEEQICYEKGLFGGTECETLPSFTLDSWVNGGLELEAFEIDTNELLGRDKLVINLISTGLPNSYNSLQEMSDNLGSIDVLSSGREPYFEE